MVLKNLKIVLDNSVIEKGYLIFENGLIVKVGIGEYDGKGKDCKGLIAMPGFIDIHIHGSSGIDFMDAKEDDNKLTEKEKKAIKRKLKRTPVGVGSILAGTTALGYGADRIINKATKKEALKTAKKTLGFTGGSLALGALIGGGMAIGDRYSKKKNK